MAGTVRRTAGSIAVALLLLAGAATATPPASAAGAVSSDAVGASFATAGTARGPGTADARISTVVDLPMHAQQWALERVQFERAWTVTRGRGVTVAVLDTGVDPSHRDLRGRVLGGATFTGAGYVHRRGQNDVQGHGTHVAGIVGARPATRGGVAGGAPDVTILPVRVLDEDGWGWASDAADGLVWAVNQGAHVVNMSVGSASRSAALGRAVAYAQSRGVLVVAASGNSGEGGPWEYPAAYPGVLAVGAVDPGDNAVPFSTAAGYVGISAPGSGVLSTVPRSVAATGQARLSGTSMAAPYVSAAAALVRATSPGLSGAQVAARLRETAEDLGAPGRDDEYGAGLVDPARAVGASRTDLPARLGAPTGLAVRELPDGTTRLSWKGVQGARSYEVLYQGLALSIWTEDGQDPVYRLRGTEADFPFFPHGLPVPLQVVAVDGRGLWSPPSAGLTVLLPARPVAAPTSVRGASPRSGMAVLSWVPARASHIVGYLVLRNGVEHDFVEPEARRYVDDGRSYGEAPVNGRAYTYRLMTVTGNGISDPSAAVLVRPYAHWATSAPRLTVRRVGNAARVSWSPPVRHQAGWRVFVDGALHKQLPVGATHIDITRRGSHNVTVVRFRTAADQGPRATTRTRL